MLDTDTINETISRCVIELTEIMTNHPDAIRPYEASNVAALGIEYVGASIDASADDFLTRFYDAIRDNPEFLDYMPADVMGQVLLRLPVTQEPGDPDAKINKKAALDVAEAIGPDWAQAWYRFIVLVTKLA